MTVVRLTGIIHGTNYTRSRAKCLVHVAVLDVGRVVPAMHDWLVSEGAEMARDTANLVVVTGSSRTSDIELQLTLGMHGPKEIHVTLYQGKG